MDRIIYTAMNGARQTMDQQAVVSHNLANVSTSGFKAQIAAMRAVPVQGPGTLPTRVAVAVTTPGADFSAGAIATTGRNLDIAMEGQAWLAVRDVAGGEAYTRQGGLQVDGNGVLLSGGLPVLGDDGPIVVPLGAEVYVGADGTLSAIGLGENPNTLVEVARLKLVDAGVDDLLRGDDGLFRPLPEAGEDVPRILPRDDDARVVSGAIESSNVSALESMVAMIDIARRYEMQLQVIQRADENEQRANNLLSLS